MIRLYQILLAVPKVLALMKTGATMTTAPQPIRLENVVGHSGKMNDVIYHSADERPIGLVVFFGGDTQDYAENMMSHRDNKAHVKWNLESTASFLHERFPSSDIFVIRPSRMHLKTFSCYQNFVEGNAFGAPTHKISVDALWHLKLLLHSIAGSSSFQNVAGNVSQDVSCSFSDLKVDDSLPISLIGFSKGCVVLNQLLYSFAALSEKSDKELNDFVKLIKVMCWLDGAHPGTSNTWVTDKNVLQNFCKFKIKIRIHVTPYQVMCDSRPRIGKEEKIFRETLKRLNADIQRILHFEDEPRSLENHFRIIEVFTLLE